MTTGELDRRVTVRRWTTSKDLGGGLTPVQILTWELWAAVRDRSGSNGNANEQSVWEYDTTITVQHDILKPIQSNDTIDYEGWRYKIESISINKEGRKDWAVIRCSRTDKEVGSVLTQEIIEVLSGSLYALWHGKLSQSGTAAPVVTIRNNNLGTVVWSRDSQGNYIGTSAGLFTAGKTDVLVWPGTNNISDMASAQGAWLDVNRILIHSYDIGSNDVDNELRDTIVEIRRYV